MDLTQLANLGEFIGGVAVLVTLVYLAAQVRQSRSEIQRNTETARAAAYHQAIGQIACNRPAGRLIGGRRSNLELGPPVLRLLGRQVPHAVRQAALARRSWKAGLDRLENPRGPVGDDQQRVAQAA